MNRESTDRGASAPLLARQWLALGRTSQRRAVGHASLQHTLRFSALVAGRASLAAGAGDASWQRPPCRREPSPVALSRISMMPTDHGSGAKRQKSGLAQCGASSSAPACAGARRKRMAISRSEALDSNSTTMTTEKPEV